MPTLLLKTNVELAKESQHSVIKECSSIVSKHLGKPESFVMVSYETSTMSFGGTFDPCAYVYLASLGALGPVNDDIVKAISDVLEREVGIPPNRIYVQFSDVKDRNDFGWNGSTFG